MRYTKGHKWNTRRKIVENARRLFTSQGYAATSIDDIMRACGLTRGGFYAHFRSKSRLYHEAVREPGLGGERRAGGDDEDGWIESVLDEYLEAAPAAGYDGGSRLAFFATDVGSQESEVRAAYTSAVKSMAGNIHRRVSAHLACTEDAALAVTAMMIGAAAIAQTADELPLKTRVLAACKGNARSLLESQRAHVLPVYFWVPAPLDEAGPEPSAATEGIDRQES